MTVRLVYFAWVREQIGTAAEDVELPEPTTLGALLTALRGRSAGHGLALAKAERLRGAVNQNFAGWDAEVRPGDEVAIFPPVTGG